MTERRILLFDLHSEGHHLFWLGLIIDAFLEIRCHVSLVVDDKNPAVKQMLSPRIASCAGQMNVIASPRHGILKGGKAIHAAAQYLRESMANEVFFPSLDDIASTCFRRAAFGMLPPHNLCGKISGIYIRPRPLDKTQSGFGNKIKYAGFRTMKRKGFFKNIFLLDENLPARIESSESLFHFLPDPWRKTDTPMKKQLTNEIKPGRDKCIFLFYGTDSRRKGLGLMLDSLDSMEEKECFFLLFAGKITSHGRHMAKLENLEQHGLAKVFNYYISETEQDLLFSMADFVVLPYIDHYGSSGILAHAAAYGKPVIASDFHLLGERVKEYGLGLTFRNNDAESLKHALAQAALMNRNDLLTIKHNLDKFARTCTTDAFKSAIKDVYPRGVETSAA